MFKRKRNIIALAVGILVLALATLAFAFPGQAACALVDISGLDTLPDGTRVQQAISATEKQRILELIQQGKTRIAKMFGEPRATPKLVFLKDTNAWFPFRFNEYGTTFYLANRACIIIGYKGTNLDVVAHELMHSEIFARAGAWQMVAEIPKWFDEGLAMQVDYRPRFIRTQPLEPAEIALVRSLQSSSQFSSGTDEQTTQHYTLAKTLVQQWLAKIGDKNLYSSLERLRQGEKFISVFGQ